jgi:tetratricopeptide (TPR) repeat protein
MNRRTRLVAVLAVAAALLSTAGCNKLRARDQLNKGVQAYKSANYEQAIDHFQNAVGLDSDLKVAKLYLATAYAQQYVPGVDTPENLRMAQQAIEEYQRVLEKDPASVSSLQGIGYLYMQMKKWDQAREYYRKTLDLDPNDPANYYSLGFIAWSQAYENAALLKAKNGMKVDDPFKKGDQKICEELRAQNAPIIEDGMKMLQTAMDKRDDYDDAMSYMNLLYRRKADIACDDASARASLGKTADDWVNRAMAARKKKAEEAAKKNQGGIILDQAPTPQKK